MSDNGHAAQADTVPATGKLTCSGFAWAMLECGRFPYLQLISGIVFLPYFAAVVVGDPVDGQADVATLGKIAGIAAALTAPILGASIDRFGRRKPWMAGGTFTMALLLSLLWFAMPRGAGLPVWGILAILIVVKILYSYTELLHNSMLVRASDGASLSRLSALSFGLGYGTAILTLLGFLWAFALPEQYDFWWLPAEPLFGLDPTEYEHVRIAGPIAGGALALMVMPLLLFSRDHPRSDVGVIDALGTGFRYLKTLPQHMRKHPNAGLFIFARMIYADGVAAMTMFIGVFAAGVMGWGVVELLIFGIVKLSFALLGSFVAAALEDRFESKRTIQIGLVMAVIAVSGLVGTSPDQILFFWSDPSLRAPVVDLPTFNTVPQLIFVFLSASAALSVTVVSSASRAFLPKITPPEETGAFFGLYALASSATAWLAPLLIGYFTEVTQSQRWGLAPVVLFFAVGLLLISFVKQPRAATA